MKSNHTLAKSIGIGMAVGGASAMIGSALMNRNHKQKRAVKRSMNQVMHTVGNIVDGVQSIMR